MYYLFNIANSAVSRGTNENEIVLPCGVIAEENSLGRPKPYWDYRRLNLNPTTQILLARFSKSSATMRNSVYDA